MLNKLFDTALIIGLFTSLSACASEPDPIVGKWFYAASYYEIESDGGDGFIINAQTAAPGFGWSQSEWTTTNKNDRYVVDGSYYTITMKITETDLLDSGYYGKLLRLRPDWDFNEARKYIGAKSRDLAKDPEAWQAFLDAHADLVANK